MPDIEKVIKGLEFHLKELKIGKTCFGCPYLKDDPCEIQLVENALALLKEQEDKINQLRGCINGFSKDAVPVVRCKDCKHRPTLPKAFGAEINGKWCYWCEHLKSWKPDDWFCADGECKKGR